MKELFKKYPEITYLHDLTRIDQDVLNKQVSDLTWFMTEYYLDIDQIMEIGADGIGFLKGANTSLQDVSTNVTEVMARADLSIKGGVGVKVSREDLREDVEISIDSKETVTTKDVTQTIGGRKSFRSIKVNGKSFDSRSMLNLERLTDLIEGSENILLRSLNVRGANGLVSRVEGGDVIISVDESAVKDMAPDSIVRDLVKKLVDEAVSEKLELILKARSFEYPEPEVEEEDDEEDGG